MKNFYSSKDKILLGFFIVIFLLFAGAVITDVKQSRNFREKCENICFPFPYRAIRESNGRRLCYCQKDEPFILKMIQ